MTIWREEKQVLYCLAWSVEEEKSIRSKKLIRERWWLANISQLSPPSCWSPSLWKRPNDKQISQWGCKCWPYLKRGLVKYKKYVSIVLVLVIVQYYHSIHFLWEHLTLSLVLVLVIVHYYYLIAFFVGSPNPVWAKPDIWQMLDPSFQPALQVNMTNKIQI